MKTVREPLEMYPKTQQLRGIFGLQGTIGIELGPAAEAGNPLELVERDLLRGDAE